jgi:hypothetical protein
MERRVEPEILDHLDPHDPDARQSRRELRWINAIMGNHRWLARILRKHVSRDERVLEIGAGDGNWLCSCVRDGFMDAANIVALDLAPPPEAWPESAPWIQRSVLDASAWPDADVVVANLFLHHFEGAVLKMIGDQMKRARLLIINEPARRPVHLAQGGLLAAIADFGHVTLHDMLASIRAGFLNDELVTALGITDWKCSLSITWLGAYRLVAWNPART